MIFMLLFYYAGFWLGNHQDDGYYITKVATLPYSPIGGNYNYSVGTMNTGFNSYIVNTWELEEMCIRDRFYQAYNNKSIQLLSQSINSDYAHKNNPKNYLTRRKELKTVLRRKCYRDNFRCV